MSDVAGQWECVTKTPMGDQKALMTVIPGGDGTFTGTSAGAVGAPLEIRDGTVEGNRLSWKMDMKVPLPMTLEVEAIVAGDVMTGSVKAGIFGTSPMTGKRVG